MMWFFDNAEAAEQLRTIARSWLTTPFRKYSCVKGPRGGVYCAALCEAILAECGAIVPCSFPHDGGDYEPHQARSKILTWLRGEMTNVDGAIEPQSAYLALRFAELPVTDEGEPATPLLAGDVLVQRFFRGGYHMPLITDAATGQFIHAIVPEVTEGRLADGNFTGRAIAHFRARAL